MLRTLGSPNKAKGSTLPEPALSDQGLGRHDLLVASRPAMGSYFEVRLPAPLPGALELATRMLDLIEQLEAQLTIYRDDSEVSHLNASAADGPVEVEAGLFDLLDRALAISRATGGAFDVAAGSLSDAWGFVRGPKRVPEPAELARAREQTGSRYLRLDAEHRTVAFDREGLRINLGSIGKGYAIDRAVGLARDYWLPTSCLLHGGQSSLFALGSPPWMFGGHWEVTLHNPFEPTRPLGIVRLRNQGLGTSGTTFQHFEQGGRSYGHILDPRTGEPPDRGPLSVTVIAPSATEADALSTAYYLLGPEAAHDHVGRNPGIGAIFVEPSRGDGQPRITTIGLGPLSFEPDPNVRVESRRSLV